MTFVRLSYAEFYFVEDCATRVQADYSGYFGKAFSKKMQFWGKDVLMRFELLLFLCFSGLLRAQNDLPIGLTPVEHVLLGTYAPPAPGSELLLDPPAAPPRSLAEWEELQAIVVTWPYNITAWRPLLREIIRAAQAEVTVYVVCSNPAQISNYLDQQGVPLANIELIQAPFNTVWVRDYGPNTIYTGTVDSLHFVDWIYNRPRPSDDVIPERIAEALDIDVYATTELPHDLVHTGGNFMADGMGTGFSSELVLEENDLTNPFGDSNHDSAAVHQIMREFMGIERYPLFESLPYDGINHIDMHMKLLDEETLLVARFPEGVSDGPTIEANLDYLRTHFRTPYGNPYRIVRIPQPPCENGLYPPFCQYGAEYRTYTNALFVNKTILVPIYLTPLDEPALDAWREAMPGYTVIGIDCRDIITYGGAIHCITKEVGVDDPLLINTATTTTVCANADTELRARVQHRSGIENVTLHYRTPGSSWQSGPMTATENDHEYGYALPAMTTGAAAVQYYFSAVATNGKSIVRPLPAPEGYFEANVLTCTVGAPQLAEPQDLQVFPNPSTGSAALTFSLPEAATLELEVLDNLGRRVLRRLPRAYPPGEQRIEVALPNTAPGMYFVHLRGERVRAVRSLAIIRP